MLQCKYCSKNAPIKGCKACKRLEYLDMFLASLLVVTFLGAIAYGLYSGTSFILNTINQPKSSTINFYAMTDLQKWEWAERGKDSIKNRLKDPDSAQFRNTFFHYGSSLVPVTCGEVNSKNSFGGYAGFQRFISGGSAEVSYLEGDMKNAEEFSKVWLAFCLQ